MFELIGAFNNNVFFLYHSFGDFLQIKVVKFLDSICLLYFLAFHILYSSFQQKLNEILTYSVLQNCAPMVCLHLFAEVYNILTLGSKIYKMDVFSLLFITKDSNLTYIWLDKLDTH